VRAVVQRVARAAVRVDGETVGSVGRGFLVLLGVAEGDGEAEARWMAGKIAGLRVFEDDAGKMNLDVRQVDGGVLLVSQFTLLGDCRKGRRPSFVGAAAPAAADRLYRVVGDLLREQGLPVETGVFGTAMAVELVNDGPVTILLETTETKR